MPKASRIKAPPDPNALAAESRALLDRQKVILRSAVGPLAVRDEVIEMLRSEGFEVTAKVVRVPIQRQLAAVLDDGTYVAIKGIRAYVRGATAKEAQLAARALADTGQAHRVMRTSAETLVPASAQVLAGAALTAVASRLAALVKQVQVAARRGRDVGVLRADLEASLAAALPQRSASGSRPRPERSPALSRVLRAIDVAHDDGLGLSFVPKVAGLLAADLDAATVKRALLEAASCGLVELRPEGGLGRLSDAELQACPDGPQGTRLSWVRRTEVLS
jgi:hypothetical protein